MKRFITLVKNYELELFDKTSICWQHNEFSIFKKSAVFCFVIAMVT